MSVYQKKNGKWYCNGRVNSERYHNLCIGAKTEKEAKAIEDGIRFQIRQEQLGLVKKEEKIRVYSVKFMCKKYLEYSEATKLTYKKDVTHTNFFLSFFGENKDILEILPIDIEKMKIQLKTHKNKRGEYLSNATVNRYLSSLKKAYNVMIKNKYIHYNPCNEVEKLVEDCKRDVVIPQNIQKEFLRALPSRLHRVFALIGIHTGLRKMNIFKLTKNQVYLNERCIKIPKTGNKGKKYLVIPLNRLMVRIIRPYYNNAEDYLFLNSETGKPFTTILKAIKTAGKKVGIEDLHFHDLRRTFGTRLNQKNVNLRVIQELLGHSDVSTTQRYLSVAASDKECAVESLI